MRVLEPASSGPKREATLLDNPRPKRVMLAKERAAHEAAETALTRHEAVGLLRSYLLDLGVDVGMEDDETAQMGQQAREVEQLGTAGAFGRF